MVDAGINSELRIHPYTPNLPAKSRKRRARVTQHSPRPKHSRLQPNLTPLRFPSPTEVDEPRTHIVVDGDSLAKLAGRYLDDPRRAEEILQLNRGLLSDPQLLPIGVELLIPPRSADTSIGGNSPQSYLPRAVAIHSAHGHGLVPVRPIPSGSTLTPRARLVNPRSAE